VRNLTRSLGFNSLQDAEESQSLQRGIPSAAALDSDLRPVTGPALSVHDVDSYLKRITQVEEEAQQARDEATRCAREVELLNLDLKRLTADNRSLSTSLQESRANIEEYEREKLNMREEFAERLTLKDGAITDLKKMLAEASASRLDMPVIPSPRPPAKENRSLADISYVLSSTCFHSHTLTHATPESIGPIQTPLRVEPTQLTATNSSMLSMQISKTSSRSWFWSETESVNDRRL
jgi:septal ring factor EnvC (AmiA/AmiB activator)